MENKRFYYCLYRAYHNNEVIGWYSIIYENKEGYSESVRESATYPNYDGAELAAKLWVKGLEELPC